jgi:hypothetical protein
MKKIYYSPIFVFFFLANIFPLFAQQSDYEIFLEFKNNLKNVKDAYRNTYLNTRNGIDKNINNDFNNYLNQIYTDYANKNTSGLKDIVPTIDGKFKTFIDKREGLRKEYQDKVGNFLNKWKAPEKKNTVEKVGKDYELNFSEQIGFIEDIQADLQMESTENFERLKQFLTVIINDKVELVSLKDTIDNIKTRVQTLLSQSKKDKASIGNLLSENNRRKELILKLLSMIISEHKLLPSKDLAEVKPSPFASEMYNSMNGFMDDYINLTASIQNDPDPANLKSALSAQKDVAQKFDSLYESCEKAKILKKGEREELTMKSQAWRSSLFNTLDNSIVKIFTDNGVPIIFHKDNTTDWFIKSITEFITPYTNPNDELNKDSKKSAATLQNFTKTWDDIKTKWNPSLMEAGYINDKAIADIDLKVNSWKTITSSGFFSKPWVLYAGIGLGVLILGLIIIMILKRKNR